jgi:predicted Rossmann fold flavoprotein
MHYDVIVIGGGAAGLLCAVEAGNRGRSVLVIERNDVIGRKILISGGGRCNFTNLYATPENFISDNSNFCRSALSAYTPSDIIALLEKHGIAYHEKKLGQLFCDGRALQVVQMLADECAAAGVEILTSCEVWSVEAAEAGGFRLDSDHGEFDCESLVLATGGRSIPKIGATDFALRIAAQFGLGVTEMRPGLVPLTFSEEDRDFCAALSGVSIDVEVSCGRISFRENVLFTHRGLSGPAILQASSYWREGEPIDIDLLPGESAHELLETARGDTRALPVLLAERLPRRFAQAWCTRYGLNQALDKLSERQRRQIAQRLNAWQLFPDGTEGFDKAEVMVGGVDTRELSSKTMEARKVPGLYFIGECVDVTGWLGGYNFQWAWASGYAAGQAV